MISLWACIWQLLAYCISSELVQRRSLFSHADKLIVGKSGILKLQILSSHKMKIWQLSGGSDTCKMRWRIWTTKKKMKTYQRHSHHSHHQNHHHSHVVFLFVLAHVFHLNLLSKDQSTRLVPRFHLDMLGVDSTLQYSSRLKQIWHNVHLAYLIVELQQVYM